MGILGERYGWVPTSADIPDSPEFAWIVNDNYLGSSLTELEITSSALLKSSEMKEKAFFYFRNNSFFPKIPAHMIGNFAAESSYNAKRMEELKKKIKSNGFEVFDNYPCQWGGMVEDKAFLIGLEEFALRVLNNLWNSIQKFYIHKVIAITLLGYSKLYKYKICIFFYYFVFIFNFIKLIH